MNTNENAVRAAARAMNPELWDSRAWPPAFHGETPSERRAKDRLESLAKARAALAAAAPILAEQGWRNVEPDGYAVTSGICGVEVTRTGSQYTQIMTPDEFTQRYKNHPEVASRRREGDPVIPEAAVEAAARVILQNLTGMSWEAHGAVVRAEWLYDARAALEAAVPHMLTAPRVIPYNAVAEAAGAIDDDAYALIGWEGITRILEAAAPHMLAVAVEAPPVTTRPCTERHSHPDPAYMCMAPEGHK